MNDEPKSLPCPFCGAWLREVRDGDSLKITGYVHPHVPGCFVGSMHIGVKLLGRWNTRAGASHKDHGSST